ncbi:MAG TPA: hypothetical protein VFE47_18045 [Tepidisphaeraceae bacterium]|jgi:uncharacterized integral membrane protein|nr:hypothetical protein [Tepidisphaeraceae bacterium]
MSKIWIWTKVSVFGLVLIYILFFCAINHSTTTKLWVWYDKSPEMNVLALAVCSFLAGVIATVFVRTTLVTIRQLRDMKERKRAERLHRDMEDMKAKAAMLQPKSPDAPDENIAKT